MSQVVFHPQKLAEFISLKRGHDLPESQRLPGEIPVVSSSGITGFHNEAKCEGPGVVTGRYGTLGELHYVEGSYWPLNTTLYVDEFKGNDPRFVYYFLQTLDLAQFNGAGAVPGLNRNALAMIDVAVPKPGDQKVIAEQLTLFDLLADNLMRQIKILEDAARQIYTEWFVRLRFPGHKRKSPTWPTRPLKTIADINAESLGKQHPWETLLYVDISSVSSGLVEQKTEYSLPDAPGRAKRLIAHGDIIWSCVRPNRRSHALILNPEENLVVSTGFATIRPKAVPWTYLYLALTTDAFVAYLESHAQGVAYPAVTGRDFEKAEILVPPPELLEQFDQLAKPIFEQIETLKSQIEKLRQARDLLLPRLISGQLRL